MIKWIPCELHTHTVNSDGNFTLLELANNAKKIGLQWIALTDHNTISGHMEMASVIDETGIKIIPGLEWTTFYGHMVAMGITKYIDWRDKGPSDIHTGIAQVHSEGGLVGVAHHYRFGSPVGTGCYWEFEISDWNDVDYLEVWSELFPSTQIPCKRTFDLWTQLLNKGYRITGVSGRDWHRGDSIDIPIAVTYLGIDTDTEENFVSAALYALKNGHAGVTMGPLVLLSAHKKPTEKSFIMGEEIEVTDNTETVEANLIIDFHTRKGLWRMDNEPLTVIFMSNKGRIGEMHITSETEKVSKILCVEELTWVRGELYGSIDGTRAMIAFTNPIYFKHI